MVAAPIDGASPLWNMQLKIIWQDYFSSGIFFNPINKIQIMKGEILLELRVKGLIVRETLLGETDKLLSVLTSEYGRIPVMAKGARSIRSRYMISTQLMCYSELTLYKRGDRFWLREALPVETFYAVRLELDLYALVQYLFDVCCEVCPERHPDGAGDMLRLILNTLYAIMTGKKKQELIKAAFELKTSILSGFAPDLSQCTDCGAAASDNADMTLDLVGGTLRCKQCSDRLAKAEMIFSKPSENKYTTAIRIVSPAVLSAMRYIENASIKRFLSFNLSEEYLKEFSSTCEAYLCNQIERSFTTLEFWHELRSRYSS